jgi:uncharacterized UBP type Zn finger protein
VYEYSCILQFEKDEPNLQKALDDFFSESYAEVKCEYCNDGNAGVKSVELVEAPEMLVLDA